MLILFSAVFVAAEAVGKQLRRLEDHTWVDAVVVGFAQAIALIPGTSRSGATISAGLFRDVKREDAARFAFLLSAPIIAGAGLKQMITVVGDFSDGTLGGEDFAFFATGFVTAAIVGYLSIAFLLRFLATNSLMPFVIYRVALGSIVLAVLAVQAVA
jgi:undecaprenyl-diphosphatase